MNTSTGNQSRFDITALPLPVVQAPMAGGPSTPQLAAAVSSAGGLGFLAAGYKTASSMAAEINAARELTDAPFGVNLFVPQPPTIRPDALQHYALSLAADASRLQVTLGDPRHDDDDWQNKLDVLYELPPPSCLLPSMCRRRVSSPRCKNEGYQ